MIKRDDLLARLGEIDKLELTADAFYELPDGDIDKRLLVFSENYIKQEPKAILGLDIYKYSDFDEGRQPLIPFLFDLLLDGGFTYTLRAESTLFNNFVIRDNFIPTGDGGFIIFPSPIHALAFNLYFFAALHIYNSGHFLPKLSQYIGDINIRIAITFDTIFQYENNWYGKGIIKNARILSKDKLNRFIVDKETYNYFMRNFINGIEILSIIDKNIFMRVMNLSESFYSVLFDGRYKNILKNIHVQKIEDTLAKSTKLTIYNVEIQFDAITTLDGQKTSYIFTLGNSNAVNIK